MKKIYFCHSSEFDYIKELYLPIKGSKLYKENEVILPHDGVGRVNSKEIIKECDFIIAEVSYQSTGMGIELGWAESFGKEIICIYKAGQKYSKSLCHISKVFLPYKDSDDLLKWMSTAICDFRG